MKAIQLFPYEVYTYGYVATVATYVSNPLQIQHF